MSETATRIRIADAGKHVGEEVELAGWLYNLANPARSCFPSCVTVGHHAMRRCEKRAARRRVRNPEASDAGSSLDSDGRFATSSEQKVATRLDITAVDVLQRVRRPIRTRSLRKSTASSS